MSDVTGSTSLGYGFKLAYDVNPSGQTAKVTLEWESVSLSSVTLTTSSATASIGGSSGGYTAKGSVTANWSAGNITYSVKIKGLGVDKSYSGTLVTWKP